MRLEGDAVQLMMDASASASADGPAGRISATLPEKPLVVIEPRRSWLSLNLKDLWTYRELLYFLTWRDVKVRYKQTALGAAWALLQPLLLMLIFTVFFGRLAGISSAGFPYPIFAFAGLLPWTFFGNAVTNGGNSLIGSANLVTKVYFPRMLIPIAAVASGLIDLGIAFVLLVPLGFYYRIGLHASIVIVPLLIVLVFCLSTAVGLWLSAVNVKYRDVRYALPFLIQIWMFASPVIYPVPPRWRLLLSFNPMTGIIQGFRSAVLGLPFDAASIGVSAIITLVIFVVAAISFKHLERTFADRI
jgi:lipopolysaccharide transport system permease protein